MPIATLHTDHHSNMTEEEVLLYGIEIKTCCYKQDVFNLY